MQRKNIGVNQDNYTKEKFHIDKEWSTQEVWFENGNIHYFQKEKNGELWDDIQYYENGQMRLEMREGLILNTWLKDSTWCVKDGNGVRVEYDTPPNPKLDIEENDQRW